MSGVAPNRTRMLAVFAFGVLAAGAASAGEPRLLADEELAEISVGSQAPVSLHYARTTRAGTQVAAEGSFGVIDAASQGVGNSVLWLGDGAQGQLNSLINVNAVNSEVNVLLNLNISIDSQIGTLNQQNLNWTPP